MKRLLSIVSLIFLITYTGQAQQSLPASENQTAVSTVEQLPLYKPRTKKSLLAAPDKVDFSMQVGTSIGTNFRNGAMWSNYVAPSMRYQLHPKWNISVGTMLINNQFNAPMLTAGEGMSYAKVNNFQTFVYTQGQYMATDRLRLTGTAFYELNQFNSPQLRMNPQATNFTSKGASIYAEYKISEHFSVGAGAQISNGNNYLRNGLYGSPGFYSPAAPFSPMGRW